MKNRGFTLIELLVVIAIIGLLSSTVLVSLSSAREKAKTAAAKAQINQLSLAMQLYYNDKNDLPPPGDSCSLCTSPCDHGHWDYVVDTMKAAGVMSSSPYNDPWGRAYCYDDNYKEISCPYHSYLYSSGPNGVNEAGSGDDVGMTEILAGTGESCQLCITNPGTPGCS